VLIAQLGQPPQALVPLSQLVGPPPSRHSSRQSAVPSQVMTQAPSHSTMHEVTEAQWTVLPGPTRALHSPEFVQSKLQPGPQMAPHRFMAVQLTAQFASQAAEQSCMSWHRTLQSSSQTVPQRSTL